MDITIKLSLDMVNTVLNALAEVPYKFSHNVITEIQMQASGQLNVAKPEEVPRSETPAA